jgi:cystathionine beta-lyase/cystathionine gamma-synthase
MPRPPRRLGLPTLAVTGGASHSEADTPVVQPLVQSANFIQEIGTADGLRYPRYGNAPNAEVLQRRLAMMEGAEAAIVLASGMGATEPGEGQCVAADPRRHEHEGHRRRQLAAHGVR